MRIGHFVPAYREQVHVRTSFSMLRDQQFCGINGHEYHPSYFATSSIVKARNHALHRAMADGLDLLLMQDADCFTMPGTSGLERLWGSMQMTGAAAVGAVFVCRGATKVNAEPARPHEVYEGDVGTGLILIDVAKVRDVPHPWFVHEMDEGKRTTVCGEDIYFCRKLKEHGHRVVVDYSFPTGHATEWVLSTQEVFNAAQAETAQETAPLVLG